MTYAEKLRDPRWQKKRTEVLNRDEFTCQCCGNDKRTLHVHHEKYSKDPWDVSIEHLVSLCEWCHFEFEAIKGFECFKGHKCRDFHEHIIAKPDGGRLVFFKSKINDAVSMRIYGRFGNFVTGHLFVGLGDRDVLTVIFKDFTTEPYYVEEAD